MPINIVVCVNQVVDLESNTSGLKVDSGSMRVVPMADKSAVLNGFDENAVEAALRIKERDGAHITVLSVGSDFAMDVMKKPLSMGVDRLVLVEDKLAENLDAFGTAFVLSEAIKKLKPFDLILCGRQGSDWDNAQVPQGIAEMMDLACVTIAQRIEVIDSGLIIHRIVPDGYEIVDVSLPALVTVSSELGEPRYPTLQGIMSAGGKTPTFWTATDLGLNIGNITQKIRLSDLYIPISKKRCEFIPGEEGAEVGRNLAMRLREEHLI